METLLKSGHEKIMMLFYSDKHAKIHLRDIARKTSLNENSATRFLKQLEQNNILQHEKDGNLKKYSIQKNTTTYSTFLLFDLQRFNKLPRIRKRAIHYFTEKLQEKPIITLLFGSTAKNTYTKDSDIDLLLIVNKKIKTEDAKHYTEAQTAIQVNCIQVTYKEFTQELLTKQDKVIQSALNTGYPLTNHIKYYEAYYNESIRS